MSFYIYGLRLKCDKEARYIGQTSYPPERRLYKLTQEAKATSRQTAFRGWLLSNEGATEAFKIAKVETRAEANGTERAIVAMCLRLDHRLFNRWLVPASLRLVA